ncbi:MAG: winged helix-turn-helix transcriptional regulator [Lachnospiraceae bacterium]|nr:winged helix-turn-helix transcriptional regulator [Lachnospiraceae bacterium]
MPIDHLGFQIRTLSNLISRKINQMVSEEEETLTAHQSWILDYLTLHKDQEIMQRDIEKNFSIRRSTASHMLQLMEKNGYIQRVFVPDDARMKKLIITKKGMQAQKRMKDRLCRFEEIFQSNISQKDLEYLKQLLKQLEKNLQ